MDGEPPIDDPVNERELAAFEASFKSARPRMSAEALERVHAAMRGEMKARDARRFRTRVAATVAAILLLCAGIFWLTIPVTAPSQKPGELALDPSLDDATKQMLHHRNWVLSSLSGPGWTEDSRAVRAASLRGDPELNKMTADVRFHAALGIAAPQLNWNAPFITLRSDQIKELSDTASRNVADLSPWQPAFDGEPWMQDKVPPGFQIPIVVGDASKRLENAETVRPYWLLNELSGPAIAQAIALFDSVSNDATFGLRARRWAAELRRNNTVLTMDVPGGFASGKPGPVVIDARSAPRVTFKLYRVKRPADLLAVSTRVGSDFIFADHGLQHEWMESLHAMQARLEQLAGEVRTPADPPVFAESDLAGRWDTDLTKLRAIDTQDPFEDDEDFDDGEDDDREYFGDACEAYRARLSREYAPKENPSAWLCGRVFEIPAEALRDPGAYVLVAEANGQKAYAPVVVDPLNLALRRARDGVFVLASSTDGATPIPNAEVLAEKMTRPATTDEGGAAFARFFAGGDRPLVVHANGRFAIGGFGRIFDGIHRPPWDRDRFYSYREIRRARVAEPQSVAQVFEDRHVLAAYTDRPAYRPGQEVHFKLIARKMRAADAVPAGVPTRFREDDFELGRGLDLPTDGTVLNYDVLDARQRVVGSGRATLNDFGTASGAFTLPEESALGACALRVQIAGVPRIVPDVFDIRSYRRPTFEIALGEMPNAIGGSEASELRAPLSARYLTGEPVSGGSATARLVEAKSGRLVAEANGTLDAEGRGELVIKIPAALPDVGYQLQCNVADATGQAVSASRNLSGSGGVNDEPTMLPFHSLPRFMDRAVDLPIPTNLPLHAEQWIGDKATKLDVVPETGTARVTLPSPGWWRLTTNGIATDLFVYGGCDDPWRTRPAKDENAPPERGFVNLTRYAGEDGLDIESESPTHLLALFNSHRASAGATVKLLVYAPGSKPRLLFTLEGQTVVDYATVTPPGPGPFHVVEIPIRERHAPNVYVQGCLLRPGELAAQTIRQERLMEELAQAEEDVVRLDDPKWCRIDVELPPGMEKGEALAVRVETERAEYKPGEDVAVRVSVTDRKGKPRETELSLAAVDAGVLNFGADRTERLARILQSTRPERGFMPKAWRTTHWAWLHDRRVAERLRDQAKAMAAMQQALAEAAKQLHFETAGPLPTLDGRSSSLAQQGEMPATQIPWVPYRADFRETAAWLPHLRTGPDGTASTRFALPDSLTRYRLTAVGITRQTEIGIGRAEFTTSLPLAVHVALPRFAVEGDRLQLSALVHNNTDAARRITVAWDVLGGETEGSPKQEIDVPARSRAPSTLWLRATKPGEVSIGVHAGDAAGADAEERRLPVFAMGRAQEFAVNGRGAAELRLPAGFIPESLSLSIARDGPSQAMAGLEYLVEYPYGCVEQTMSRFLPAVMVGRAAQKGATELQPEIARKLPDVLAKGLARLYHFQHADGGWGWWEKDATNLGMTIYVVYGLARCREAGVAVDGEVLKRGGQFLLKEFEAKRVPDELACDVWLSLALANAAPAEGLAAACRAAPMPVPPGWRTPPDWGAPRRRKLALAAHAAGLTEEAQRLAKTLGGGEYLHSAEGVALHLSFQNVFGAPRSEKLETAERLLAMRRGQHWEHTRATSAAIEALAGLLTAGQDTKDRTPIQVKLDGKMILDASGAEDLKKNILSLTVKRADLPNVDGASLTIDAGGATGVQYAVNARGTQRMDRLEPSGTDVRIERSYETTDGKPFKGPAKAGEFLTVRLKITLASNLDFVLVEDRRPAGWEYADERLRGMASFNAAHHEFRDDRLCVFFTALNPGTHNLVYSLRAETPGTSHVLPAVAYPMYDEKKRGETGAAVLEIAP